MVDLRQRAVVVPKIQIVVQRALRRQILRDIAPLAAGAEHIHDPVDELPLILLPLTAATLGGGDQWRDERPFVVRQITRVTQSAAVVPGAVLGRPHGQAHWR